MKPESKFKPKSRTRIQIQVSGGFWLLIIWFGLVNGWKLLFLILSAAALHEMGHWLVLRCMHVKITALRLSIFGAEIISGNLALSYGRELLAVLAGPAVNLLCACILSQLHQDTAAGVHLVLCVLNLLPIRPLDGGRSLYLLLSWIAGPVLGEWILRWIGGSCALFLAAILLWLMFSGCGSLWLLPAAAAFFETALSEWFYRTDFEDFHTKKASIFSID